MTSKKGISCADLLTYIPDTLLTNLEHSTKTNHQIKKLSGKVMFKLLLATLLESERISLRVLESVYNSQQFSLLVGKNNKTRHTSLADRINTIPAVFFKEIFNHLYTCFEHHSWDKNKQTLKIVRYDSTLVSLSSKLLQTGMQTGKGTKQRQLKYTLGLSNSLPLSVHLFTKQEEVSENIALGTAILAAPLQENEIILFDRGLQKRSTFTAITDQGKIFITRLPERAKYKKKRVHKEVQGRTVGSLLLEKDWIVQLRHGDNTWEEQEFRLIEARSQTGEKLLFLTNNQTIRASAITETYKKRWDIEVFFRFLKQELNMKHLVARSLNGIEVMLYMTLILALLLQVYKISNRITSYKQAKILFRQDIEMEIMKELITFCGGDISKLAEFKNRSPA